MNYVLSILGLLASWIVSGLITYGYQKAKTAEFERRLLLVEGWTSNGKFARKEDVDDRYAGIGHRLDRMEDRLDLHLGKEKS